MKKLRLPIANPCHEDWDGMSAQNSARRFCDSCAKSVHNISELTEPEARALLAAPRGEHGLCIRYSADADGQVRFRTPMVQAPPPPSIVGWRAGVAAGIAAVAMAGCTDATRPATSVQESHCTYEIGPFDYTLARGEGNCPPAEQSGQALQPLTQDPDHDPDAVMMGAAPVQEDPIQEMGEIAEEPPVPSMGEAPMLPDEPCDPAADPNAGSGPDAPDAVPEPIKLMGKVAPPVEEHVMMGDVAEMPTADNE